MYSAPFRPPLLTDTISTHLFADITDSNTRQEIKCPDIISPLSTERNPNNLFHSLDVPQLRHKRLYAPLLALYNHLSKYSRMRCRAGSSTDPPLGGAQVRGVNDKLVRLLVECSGSLQTRNIGTMRQLCHGETSNHTIQTENTLIDPICFDSSAMIG